MADSQYGSGASFGYDPTGNRFDVEIRDGISYIAGTNNRPSVGSTIETAGGIYKMTPTGGVQVSQHNQFDPRSFYQPAQQYVQQLQQGGGSYQSPYTGQIQGLLQDIQGAQFEYDPSQDAALQQAQKQSMQANLEEMNARGILNSTVTAERGQQVAQQLVPQYEQQAYSRFQNELSQKYQMASFLQSMEQQAYNTYQDQLNNKYRIADYMFKLADNEYAMFKDEIAQREQQAQAEYDMAIQQMELEQKQVDSAWKRVSNLGYVDNEASVILGVAAGTLSKDAREAVDKYNQALAAQQRSIAASYGRTAMTIQAAKEAAALREEQSTLRAGDAQVNELKQQAIQFANEASDYNIDKEEWTNVYNNYLNQLLSAYGLEDTAGNDFSEFTD